MFTIDDLTFSPLLSELQALCQRNSLSIATAESCTGGLIGALLSHQSGSSGHFLGGVIAYSNDVKSGILQVPLELIVEYGAVSAPVAASMAQQVRRLLGSSYALSVTGIAGPSGGSTMKPVGTVWCGWASPQGLATQMFSFSGTREDVRSAAAKNALQGLLKIIQNDLKE